MKVIINVDDATSNRRIMKIFLEKFTKGPHIILDACNGEEAFKLYVELVEGNYEVEAVVTDFNMPVVDGGRLAMMLRDSGYQGPIIVVTSNRKVKLVEGADKVFYKPVTKDLIERISYTIKEHDGYIH